MQDVPIARRSITACEAVVTSRFYVQAMYMYIVSIFLWLPSSSASGDLKVNHTTQLLYIHLINRADTFVGGDAGP